MNESGDQQIVPGISVTASGQATVDPFVAEVLLDLAIKLEEPTNLPVDVEHVLAAIVLAARGGEFVWSMRKALEKMLLKGFFRGMLHFH